MKKTLLIGVTVVAVLVCTFAVWKLYSPKVTPTPSGNTNPTTLVDEKTALATLQADLQNVTPHFIANTEGNGHATLTLEEQKIQDDLVAIYAARYAAQNPSSPARSWLVQAQNGTWLNAIGKRYILLTEADVKKARDQIFDTQTGVATPIPDGLRFYFAPDRDIVLYLDLQAIHTYSLDQSTAILVPGSQLSGTETYHSGYAEGIGVDMDPRYTKTKNSITISVFDSSKMVPNPDVQGAQMYAKVGTKTLSF